MNKIVLVTLLLVNASIMSMSDFFGVLRGKCFGIKQKDQQAQQEKDLRLYEHWSRQAEIMRLQEQYADSWEDLQDCIAACPTEYIRGPTFYEDALIIDWDCKQSCEKVYKKLTEDYKKKYYSKERELDDPVPPIIDYSDGYACRKAYKEDLKRQQHLQVSLPEMLKILFLKKGIDKQEHDALLRIDGMLDALKKCEQGCWTSTGKRGCARKFDKMIVQYMESDKMYRHYLSRYAEIHHDLPLYAKIYRENI